LGGEDVAVSNQHEHKLLAGALRVRAAEYCNTLYAGATVDEADWRYLDETDWGRYVVEELAARDLCIDGDTVVPLLRRATGT
jgi:hypothetical protein